MIDDPLSSTFAALADPTRRAILARLAKGEANVSDLAEPFAMSLQAISKHLKVLERAGLVSRGKDAQWRPCRLEAAPLELASSWIEVHREIWNDRLDQLGRHLQTLQRADEQQPPQRTRKTRT
jgi:DNA-binding transcriptional ArsR family regulator